MHLKDVKLNKIYHVTNINNISVGILIPHYIENNEIHTYTIQTAGNSDWLYMIDIWSERDDWTNIEEFENGTKTENGEKVDKKYIIDRIFTSRIKFD